MLPYMTTTFGPVKVGLFLRPYTDAVLYKKLKIFSKNKRI